MCFRAFLRQFPLIIAEGSVITIVINGVIIVITIVITGVVAVVRFWCS